MRQSSSNRRRARPRRYSLWRLLRANMFDLGLLLRESWVVLAAFLMVTLVGMLYLTLAYDPCGYDADPASSCRLGPGEALYETLKLQTLQSGLPFPSDRILGQALFFLIPLLGLALIFQGVLNFGRHLLDKGSRREVWQFALAATYRDHVIVCGLGRVGMHTVTQLIEAGYAPVVIEKDWTSEFVERAINSDVPVVVGDAREPLTLRRAGLQRARAVIAAISDDLLNVEIALVARSLHAETRLILRVFSDELDQNLERTFGRNAAYSASALAAPTFAAAAVSREIEYVLPSAVGPLAIAELSIRPGSALAGSIAEFEQARGVRVIAYHSARELPDGGIRPGDRITLIGGLAALERVRLLNHEVERRDLPIQHPDDRHDTVIICGLGKVAYRVVRQLYALEPRPRIVVVRLTDGRPDFPQRIAELAGVETIIGDARELDVLRQAGLDRAFSVAALTSDDLLNLHISLAARRARPDIHVVVRVFSEALADRLAELFGIRTAYSTAALAGPTLAAAGLVGGVEHGFLADGQLLVSERIVVEATSIIAGLTLAQIRERQQALVIELRRGLEVTSLPALDTVPAAGDEVTLIAPIEAVAKLR